jgi:peptidoglycan/xylan/chitin deacetylase (PgdA/CDA1 family)
MIGSLTPYVFLGAAQRRLMAGGWPILTYHKLGAPPRGTRDPFLYVRPEEFDRQLAALGRAGYRSGSLDEVSGSPTGGSTGDGVVITFDDGCGNVLEHGLAPLSRHRFGAIQFLVAGMLGRRNEWDLAKGDTAEGLMDEAQVRTWLAAGHEIGSHSLTHRNLRHLEPAALREEVVASKKLLEDRFGLPIRHFCYPYGSWNTLVRDCVAEAGYATACTMDFGVNPEVQGRFELRRIIPLSAGELLAKVAHRLRRQVLGG